MKVEVLRENLKNGLAIVDRVSSKNLSLPALNNVLVNAEDSFLNLTSTDLETTIRLWILTKIIKGGKLAMPIKLFSSFTASLPNEKITLESKGQNMHLECAGMDTNIQGANIDDFPIIPPFQEMGALEINNKLFCEGLSQVVNIASNSVSRPEISGIYFIFSKNNLKIVATDSFRLAEKTIKIEGEGEKEYSFILPQKPAKEIINILDGKEGNLKIYFSDNQIMFEFKMAEIEHPQLQITSRTIEGEYPNYLDIIPTKFKTTAVIKKEDFLNQIKTASLFSSRVNEVKIAITPDRKEISISANNAEVGESKSNVSAKIEGDPIEISFNYKFLIDGLLHIKSSEVFFEASKEEGACILRPVGDASYVYVVMPIKSI